jgi:hypothetical protein
MSQTRLHEVSQRGTMAELAYDHAGTHLRTQETRVIAKMKSLYRSSKYDQAQIIACVGELCAIEDLDRAMQREILAGREARKELVDAKDQK